MFLLRIADTILKAIDVARSRLKTMQGSLNAELGVNSRVLSDGSIVNIRRERAAISVGANGCIRGELLIHRHAGRIRAGDWLYVGPRTTIWSSDPDGIVLGDRVLISSDVMIHDTNSHSTDANLRFEQTKAVLTSGHPADPPNIKSAPIRLGDDVWVGYGATILKGVSIGDRAIIGARAIVNADVPPDGNVRAGAIHSRQEPQ